MKDKEDGEYRISDELWAQIRPLLPPEPYYSAHPKMDSRKAMNAIFSVLRSGYSWEDYPELIDLIYERLVEWRKTGSFDRLWQACILTQDELRRLILYRKC